MLFYDTMEYHRDELLYLAMGEHPAWGYASVPPMIGWIAFLLNQTTGYSLFVVKLVPAIAGGLTLWTSTRICRELGGDTFARILTAVGFTISVVFLRVFHLFQPVSLDILFWTLTIYYYLRWYNTRHDLYLVTMGLVAGLGIMSKYLILLLLIPLGIVFVYHLRKAGVSRRRLYQAIGLLGIIILPNLIWQIMNGLPVLTHMQALNSYQLVYVSRTGFLLEQLIMPGIGALIVLPGFIFLIVGRKLRPYRFLWLIAVFVIITLLVLRGKSYYTAGLFPFLIAAGAIGYERLVRNRYLRIGIVILLIFISRRSVPVGIPIYPPQQLAEFFKEFAADTGVDSFLRYEDGNYYELPQDYADMIGWEQLAEITAAAYHQLEEPDSAVIYCENYGQAGALIVHRDRLEIPEPICFSGSFYYWFPRELPEGIHTLIYINDEAGEDIEKLFGEIRAAGSIDDPLAREFGTTVYICTEPRQSLAQFWQKRLTVLETPFD